MDINNLKLLYLDNKFNSCDCIEQYYFNLYIAKKTHLLEGFTFKVLLNILGYNECEYIFKQNEIDECIKHMLIVLYFSMFKKKILHLISDFNTNDPDNVLYDVICLFSNTYLTTFRRLIIDDFNFFVDDIIRIVFDQKRVSYTSKYDFVYELIESDKPYDDLIHLLGKKRQIYDSNEIEDIYNHCLYIFRDKKRFSFIQHKRLFELLKGNLMFEHNYIFKMFIMYYRERNIVFMQYLDYINDIIINHECYKSSIIDYNIKHTRKILCKMILNSIKYNKMYMKCAYTEKINNIICTLYKNMNVVSEYTFLRIISFYFKNYNNILKLVNVLKNNNINNKKYIEVNKHVFDIIDDYFVLSQRDKNKIKLLLKC